MAAKFSKKEAIRFGWKATKANLGFLLVVMILVWVVFPAVFNLIDPSESIFRFSDVINFAVSTILFIGLTQIALKLVDGKRVRFKDLVNRYDLFFKFFGAQILYSLLVVVGLILLIIPGIYWAVKYQFYGYFVVDKGLGPVASLKQSGKITQGVKWNLISFWALLAAIGIAGILVFLVGVFVAIPIIMLAHAWVYRKLSTK